MKQGSNWTIMMKKRGSNRFMSVKLDVEAVIMYVVSGFAQKVGCEMEEKENIWSEFDELEEVVPREERVVIEADTSMGLLVKGAEVMRR